MYWLVALVVVAGLAGGCAADDDDPEATKPKSVTLTGATACERYASLGAQLGCAHPESCEIASACESQAISWIDCAATDTRQCYCESSGGTNCEGSFKANEGPAACVPEYQAFKACDDAN